MSEKPQIEREKRLERLLSVTAKDERHWHKVNTGFFGKYVWHYDGIERWERKKEVFRCAYYCLGVSEYGSIAVKKYAYAYEQKAWKVALNHRVGDVQLDSPTIDRSPRIKKTKGYCHAQA